MSSSRNSGSSMQQRHRRRRRGRGNYPPPPVEIISGKSEIITEPSLFSVSFDQDLFFRDHTNPIKILVKPFFGKHTIHLKIFCFKHSGRFIVSPPLQKKICFALLRLCNYAAAVSFLLVLIAKAKQKIFKFTNQKRWVTITGINNIRLLQSTCASTTKKNHVLFS